MPIDESDLTFETIMAISIYRSLPDMWAGMSGHFLGKDLASLRVLLDIYSIDDNEFQKYILLVIKIMDAEVADMVSNKIKNESKAKKPSR